MTWSDRFPAWSGGFDEAAAASGTRRVESLGSFKLVKTHEEDTAVRAVSPPLMFLYGSIRGTSRDALEEVSFSPHRIQSQTRMGMRVKLMKIKKSIVSIVSFITAASASAAFQCEVQVPAGGVGASRTATVTYFNDGTSAIAAPYVRLEAGNNAYVRFSESDAWSKSVEFLATSDQSPASSLRAGETVEIPVFVYTATQEAQLTLSYTQSSTETVAIDQQEENQ